MAESRKAEKNGGARVIAYLGKGGTGKTVISSLTARLLIENKKHKVLMIDADPAMGLVLALGLRAARTVYQVREEMVKKARQEKGDHEHLLMMFDYLLMEALHECDGYSLLVMGAGEGPGCFCPLNTLLRESVEELAGNFDYIVIDAEAGIEQVHRMVTKRVAYPVIVTDASLRGVSAAQAIKSSLLRLEQSAPAGVIFNRMDRADPGLEAELKNAQLECLGFVPQDQEVAKADTQGKSLLELPPDSPAVRALEVILKTARIIHP